MKNQDVVISFELFSTLIDNTVECMNSATSTNNFPLADEYKKDLDACNEILEAIADKENKCQK